MKHDLTKTQGKPVLYVLQATRVAGLRFIAVEFVIEGRISDHERIYYVLLAVNKPAYTMSDITTLKRTHQCTNATYRSGVICGTISCKHSIIFYVSHVSIHVFNFMKHGGYIYP